MAECSSDDFSQSLTNPSRITCLSRGDSIGLTISVEAGLLSLLAILYVLLIIAYNRWRIRNLPNADLRIFHQPMDILMASLLLGDVFQAIGIVLSLKYVRDGKVEIGSYCNTQGIFKIVGATGGAFSTLAIAVYTFLGVWVMRDIMSMRFTYVVVATLWSFIAVFVAVAMAVNRNQEFSFIGPAPYWCWLNKYGVGLGWKMAAEYLWMWVTLFVSIVLYVPLYLWMRGNLITDEAVWWRAKFDFGIDVDPETRARRRQSIVMLAYPVVYCLCILPLSAVRWTSFVGTRISPTATLAVVAVFGLSGFFNVILLLKTRPSSGLFGHLMFLRPATPLFPDDHHVQMVDTGFGRPPPEIIPIRA